MRGVEWRYWLRHKSAKCYTWLPKDSTEVREFLFDRAEHCYIPVPSKYYRSQCPLIRVRPHFSGMPLIGGAVLWKLLCKEWPSCISKHPASLDLVAENNFSRPGTGAT